MEVAAKSMGLKFSSSSGKLALATMRYFGYFDYIRGDEMMARLSPLALDAASDYPPGSRERRDAIKRAALNPGIHRELWKKYGPSLPPDDELRRFLIRERKYTDSAAVSLIAEYKETIVFEQLTEADKTADEGTGGADMDSDTGDQPPQQSSDRQPADSRQLETRRQPLQKRPIQWPERTSKDSAEET